MNLVLGKKRQSVLALAVATALTACSGSGGDTTETTQTQAPTTDTGQTNNSGSGQQTNSVPVVNAGVDQTVKSGTEVMLAASATDDNEVTYSWSQTSGSSVNLSATDTANVSFVAPEVEANETLQFQVSVSDGVNDAVTDSVSVTVEPVIVETNDIPQVDAGDDRSVAAGENVTLVATVIDDDEVSYSWRQLSGDSVALSANNTATVSFVAPSTMNAQDLIFELTVNDNVNAAVVDLVTISVAAVVVEPNDVPQLDAGADQSVQEGESVTLTATVVDDDEVSYSWQQLSGKSVTLSATDVAQISFTAPDVENDQQLVFQVDVNDNVNPVVSDTVTVTVTAVVEQTPTSSWVINTSNELAKHIVDSVSGLGVEVNVQSVNEQQVGGKQYTVVTSEGIPNYSVTINQDIYDGLANRPKASTDFVGGAPTVSVGDIVEFGQDIGYSSNRNCGADAGFGYWPPGPECPSDSTRQGYFPQQPEPADSEDCKTGLGKVGLWVNGSSVYNWGDGHSYNDQGDWQNLAPIAEAYDVDICGGHAARSDYHHHFYSSCLADMVGDKADGHSPLYGFAADGYPIYGPWEADGVLATSSWVVRDYNSGSATGCSDGSRSCVLVDQYDVSKGTESVSAGPGFNATVTTLSGNRLVATNGYYKEDYYWDSSLTAKGGQYLDQYNGHSDAVRGYHYHVTVEDINGKLVPSFPFTVGVSFAGELESNAISSCSTGSAPGGRPGAGE